MMSKTVVLKIPKAGRGLGRAPVTSIAHQQTTTSARMVVGSWTIQIVLLSLLDPTGVVIYLGWTPGNGTNV